MSDDSLTEFEGDLIYTVYRGTHEAELLAKMFKMNLQTFLESVATLEEKGYVTSRPVRKGLLGQSIIVELTPKGYNYVKSKKLEAELSPVQVQPSAASVDNGILSIRTVPFSADVYVNGIYWGSAPVVRSVPPGSYQVTFIDVEGYRTPDTVKAYVQAGKRTEIIGKYVYIAAEEKPRISTAAPPVSTTQQVTVRSGWEVCGYACLAAVLVFTALAVFGIIRFEQFIGWLRSLLGFG